MSQITLDEPSSQIELSLITKNNFQVSLILCIKVTSLSLES